MAPELAAGVVSEPGVALPAGTVVVPVTAPPRVTESMSPRTTVQEDLTTAGQRKVNLIWEYTQAAVAVAVVVANMTVGTAQGLGMVAEGFAFPVILSSSLFLIVGFYFSRTNHAAIGGIGFKPTEEYKGR
jgi:hypothetical protein